MTKFACPVKACGEQHATAKQSKAHQRTAHKPEKSPQKAQCKLCSGWFGPDSSGPASLAVHSPICEQGVKQRRTCATCNKTLKSISALETHVLTCGKGCVCPTCKRLVSTDLGRHAAECRAEHTCPVCKKVVADILVHVAQCQDPAQSMSPQTPGTVFVCPHEGCGKSHDTASKNQHHQRKHAKGEEFEKRQVQTKFVCPHCDKSHGSAKKSQRHQAKHGTPPPTQPLLSPGPSATCPVCKVHNGPVVDILEHVAVCREQHTCPNCSTVIPSLPQLMGHIMQCKPKRKRSHGGSGNIQRRLKMRKSESDSDDDTTGYEPQRLDNEAGVAINHWKTPDVQRWLGKVELAEYAYAFAAETVDGFVLMALTEEEIKRPPYSMKNQHAKKFLQLRAQFRQ